MREFRSNVNDFIRGTRRRMMVEVSILVLLGGYFWSDWSGSWPNWLQLSVLALFTAYILFGLACYPQAKSIAQTFYIRLMDDALGFPSEGDIKQVPYRDLTISKVTKKNDEVVAIRLKTTFGQSITLRGLDNMKELYEGLAAHVGRSA